MRIFDCGHFRPNFATQLLLLLRLFVTRKNPQEGRKCAIRQLENVAVYIQCII